MSLSGRLGAVLSSSGVGVFRGIACHLALPGIGGVGYSASPDSLLTGHFSHVVGAGQRWGWLATGAMARCQ